MLLEAYLISSSRFITYLYYNNEYSPLHNFVVGLLEHLFRWMSLCCLVWFLHVFSDKMTDVLQ